MPGLLDSLTGLFKSSGVQDTLTKNVSSMFSDGTLSLSKIKEGADKAGLGDIFDSWTGKGDNKEITPEQLKQAAPNLEAIAEKSGISVDEAANELSKVLPDMVDKMTPDGVMVSDDAVRSALGA